PAPRLPHSFPTRRSSDLRAAHVANRGGHRAEALGLAQGGQRVGRFARLADRHDERIFGDDRITVAVFAREIDLDRKARFGLEDVDRKSTRLNSSHGSISY